MRRRWPLSQALPSRDLLAIQNEWLRPARAGLLRRARIATRQRVLDLGAGYGQATGELHRRCGGWAGAVDHRFDATYEASRAVAGPSWLCADAHALPFGVATFDLVFSQFVLLWVNAEQTAGEVYRVLRSGGSFALIEPDYGGMLEHPETIVTRRLWMDALHRAGADPLIGRRLPALLERAGFDVEVEMTSRPRPANPVRLDLLTELHLTPEERQDLERIRKEHETLRGTWGGLAHLPLFLISATKR